ncbi:MAG: DUF4080 domain-containing protein [Clostridia bacterium]|nr:DUF4080 domain-containing protein [Clostridia bacterium]
MLLVGINAKYVHSNLAIRYLSKMEPRFGFCEYTISDRPESLASALFRTGAKTFLFSCYIWNIEHVLKVCEILKKADSSVRILLGGPEVSIDAEERLAQHDYIDFVLCGEGEKAISSFADSLESGDFSCVPGLYYREDSEIKKSLIPPQEADLNEIPFPYETADMPALSNRIVYYETSRGCPYRCAFCLSGVAGSLRFLPVARVERELAFFEEQGVPLVKLVDRTFNADPDRALTIIEGIKKRGGKTTYHFEIRAESMTEALIHSLQEAPKGMFQLEIGVQSTQPETLKAICRNPQHQRLVEVVQALSKNRNMHLHLDLIAGLPGETLEAFVSSFHDVMKLRPNDLQLGFLKKLKGSALCAPGSEFQSFPPYEVVHSDGMRYEELLHLKQVEEMLERYYNSGVFTNTILYILDTYYPEREFDFFAQMAAFLKGDTAPKSQKTAYEDLYRFACVTFHDAGITHRLIYDYCLRHRDSLSFMQSGDGVKSAAFEFLKQPERVKLYFADYAGEKPVSLYKKIRFVPIGSKIFAFDYEGGRAIDVTTEFKLEE